MKLKIKMITLTTVLILAMTGQCFAAAANPFTDIDATKSKDKIIELYDKGVIKGTGNGLFNPDGTVTVAPKTPTLQVEIGESPTEIVKRIQLDNPEDMSRAQIAEIIRSGQLTQNELRKYVATYQEKLARPFACFVFTLIAIPFGIRSVRGGGSTSIGFGLAVALIFVYYVVSTIFSYIGEAMLPLAAPAAWMPNLIFTYLGVARLRKAASV